MEPHLSPSKPEANNATEHHDPMPEVKQLIMDIESVDAKSQKPPSAKTPELADEPSPDPPSTPGTLASFDWEDFETSYEQALRNADKDEEEILKKADALAKYFRVWASAASTHDNERATKRLQTRRRFVNLSEEKMEQRQQHYDEVVRAFESALALLRSN